MPVVYTATARECNPDRSPNQVQPALTSG